MGLLAIVSFTVTAIMSAPVVLIFIPIVFPVAVALALPGLEALRDECVAGPVGAVRAHDFWRDSMVVREEMDIHRVDDFGIAGRVLLPIAVGVAIRRTLAEIVNVRIKPEVESYIRPA